MALLAALRPDVMNQQAICIAFVSRSLSVLLSVAGHLHHIRIPIPVCTAVCGRPSASPPQYAELSFNELTPNEEMLLARMEAKINKAQAPYWQGVSALELSAVQRMCCFLAHTCQGISQRNALTHSQKGRGVFPSKGPEGGDLYKGEAGDLPCQRHLEQINTHAGNIETTSRKIMCLVDPRKDRVAWPTACSDQLSETEALKNGIQHELNMIRGIPTKFAGVMVDLPDDDRKADLGQIGAAGVLDLPELLGFNHTAKIGTKEEAIQRNIDLLNRCLDISRRALNLFPESPELIKKVKYARNVTFWAYNEVKDPHSQEHEEQMTYVTAMDSSQLKTISKVNCNYHKVTKLAKFTRTKRGPVTIKQARQERAMGAEAVKDRDASKPESEWFLQSNVGRLVRIDEFDVAFEKAFRPEIIDTGAIMMCGWVKNNYTACQDIDTVSTEPKPGAKGVGTGIDHGGRACDWWEIMWIDGSFSYMSYWGSWLTVASDNDYQTNSGLSNEIHMPTLYSKDQLAKAGRLSFTPAKGDHRFPQELDLNRMTADQMSLVEINKEYLDKQLVEKQESKKTAEMHVSNPSEQQ